MSERKKTNIVCLHGLAASGRFFGPLARCLAEGGDAEVFCFDLLGFGENKRRGEAYTLDEHLGFITQKAGERFGDEKIALVGHSMGGILALAWASRFPQRVSHIVLLNTPLAETQAEVGRGISGMARGWAPILYKHAHVSRLSCAALCQTGILRFFAARFHPANIPADVAADYALHTWRSLYQTFRHIVLETPAVPLARTALAHGIPVLSITAAHDSALCRYPLEREGAAHAELPGTHYLPLERPREVAEAIRSFVHTSQKPAEQLE